MLPFLHRLFLTSTIALWGSGAHAQDASVAESLSLQEALQGALARNFTVRASRLDTALAEQSVRSAQGTFDPELTARYAYDHESLLGVDGALEDAQAAVGIAGVLPTGTEYFAGFRGSDATNPTAFFDPETNQDVAGDRVYTDVSFEITQPLLRGFRANGSQTKLTIARRVREQSDEAFRAAVMNTATATITAYHALYFAERNLLVAQRNQANAAKLLRDNRRRVDSGAMAPLDIYQAESEVAVRESAVINARRLRRTAQNRLKALFMDGSPGLLEREITIPDLPAPEAVTPDPLRDYGTALEQRPDYRQMLTEGEIRDAELARDRWAARPQVDLFARVGRYTTTPTFSDSIGGLDTRANDRYSVGVVFSRPLFNRTREATRAASLLRRNKTEVLKRQLEQQIMLELDDAAATLIAAGQRVASTRVARELAEKSLRAEEKKLRIGTSSTFVVLRLQGDLANAEIRELSAIVEYYSAEAAYEQTRGTTLEAYGLKAL